MRHPELFLFTLGWQPLPDLRKSIVEARRSLRAVRLGPLRGIRVIGVIEPHIPPPGHCSNVHVHAVVDGPVDERLSRLIARAWRRETQGEGTFGPDPDTEPRVRSAHAAARYLAKHADWSPAPGSMPSAVLGILFRAIHAQPLPINWGKGRTARATRSREDGKRRKRRVFYFPSELAEVVEQALIEARHVIGTDDPSAALAFIAANYVLTELDPTREMQAQCLRVIERAMGLDLMVFDAKTMEVRHGAQLAQQLGLAMRQPGGHGAVHPV